MKPIRPAGLLAFSMRRACLLCRTARAVSRITVNVARVRTTTIPDFFATTASAHFSSALTEEISPGKCRICPLAPPGSTLCILMIFGLRCSGPARRLHPASLPVHVLTVDSLLRASFSFPSRFGLAFRYGCLHRPRLAPFIQLDSAHAGHTPCARPPGRASAAMLSR